MGYLGFVNVPFGALADTGVVYPPGQIAHAPVIGIRYWFSQGLGLDVGLGFTMVHGNNSTQDPITGNTTTVNAEAPTAFVIHGGLPLSFASSKHFNFELIPEINVGYASMSTSTGGGAGVAATTTDYSGIHFDVGARIGSEIYFGFIGIPQLSLQGSVGILADIDSTQTKVTPGTVNAIITTNSSSRSVVGTTVNDNPWNIFIGNVSALYYL